MQIKLAQLGTFAGTWILFGDCALGIDIPLDMRESVRLAGQGRKVYKVQRCNVPHQTSDHITRAKSMIFLKMACWAIIIEVKNIGIQWVC